MRQTDGGDIHREGGPGTYKGLVPGVVFEMLDNLSVSQRHWFLSPSLLEFFWRHHRHLGKHCRASSGVCGSWECDEWCWLHASSGVCGSWECDDLMGAGWKNGAACQ